MRYMLIVRGTKHFEAGVKSDHEAGGALAAYSKAMIQAGVLLAAEALQPSASAMIVTFPADGGEPVVKAGPFAEEMSWMAGFAIIETATEEAAIEWAARMPRPSGSGARVLELRRLADGPKVFFQMPEIQGVESDLRDHIDMLKKS